MSLPSYGRVLLAALPLLAACGGSTDSKSEVAGRIALIAHRGAEYRLALANADGSSLQVLPGVGRDDDPVWSPNGTRLAFQRENAGGYADIFLMDPATGLQGPLLTTERHEYGVTWSPDGARLAFAVDAIGADSIYAVNTNGTGLTALVEGAQPAWSANDVLAFVASGGEPNGGMPAVFTREIGGGAVTRASAADTAVYMDPAWSATGALAMVRRKIVTATRSEWSLVVRTAAGGTQVALSDTTTIRHPTWSPDGRHLIVTRSTGGYDALWAVRADGTRSWRITPAASGTTPYGNVNASWRPAGR